MDGIQHKPVGTQLTQAEYEGDNTHIVNYVPFTNLKLYEYDSNTLSLENLAGGTLKNLRVANLSATSLSAPTSGTATRVISAANSTDEEKAHADVVCKGYSTLTAELAGATLISPATIESGSIAATTVTVSGTGGITVTLPAGMTAIATSGTSVVTGSPKALVAGANTVTATGAGVFYISGMGDEQEINAALVSFADAGGLIHLSSGIFYIHSPVNLNYAHMVTIEGVNEFATDLKLVNRVNTHMFTFNRTSTIYATKLKQMHIEGNYGNQSTGNGININWDTANGKINDMVIEDVFIQSFKGIGLKTSTSWGLRCTRFISEYNQSHGISMDWFGSNAQFTQCKFNNNGGSGAVIQRNYCVFVATEFQDNTADGVWITSSADNNIINACQFLHNGVNVRIDDGCTGNIISSNEMLGAISWDVLIGSSATGAQDNSVYGNQLLSTDKIYQYSGSRGKNYIYGNYKYLEPGEVRTYSGTITAGGAGTITSLDNPFGQTVAVLNLQINVTTADADAPNIDADLNAANNSVAGLSLFDDLPGETTGYYLSTVAATGGKQTVPQLWGSGSGNRYLNIAITDNDGTQLVATYTVTVMRN